MEELESLMSKIKYLTKSRFKTAYECPRKLYYLEHKEYGNKNTEDEFLAALAEGGFQVGALAKACRPKVFIWMSSMAWRYQHSNGEFRGAVEYISIVSGCSRSTVTRALRDLKALKLIECVEQNFKKGNLWRVSSIANGRGKNNENQDGQIEQGACSI